MRRRFTFHSKPIIFVTFQAFVWAFVTPRQTADRKLWSIFPLVGCDNLLLINRHTPTGDNRIETVTCISKLKCV